MNYADKNLNEFVKYVTGHYPETNESDLFQILDREFSQLLSESRQRKTANFKKIIQEETLANCRRWLVEPRLDFKPWMVFSYRPARIYFGTIKKAE